jgi:predicted enzyme related to lactoylglutathione lyase
MLRSALLTAVLVMAVGVHGAFCQEEEPSTPGHPVLFWELASHDMDRSADFFREVFDWDIRFDEDLGFYKAPAGDASKYFSGGYVFTLKEARLPFLTIYILVDDIEAKAKLIEEKGGYIIEAPHDLGGGYKICLFNEPSGVTFAMFQPAT